MPFICFLGGYLTIHFFFNVNKIYTPSLVGNNIGKALITLSCHNLNPRILGEKEDPDLPEGTIISQTPEAGQKIKPHQSIFLLLSKHPKTRNTPNMINKPLESITKILKEDGIRAVTYYMPHTYPEKHCFAQFPEPNKPIAHNRLILYISTGNTVPIIWPDFTNQYVAHVLPFLSSHKINTQIIHYPQRKEDHVCQKCRVTDQRPRAGSLIRLNPNHPLRVQLCVKK